MGLDLSSLAKDAAAYATGGGIVIEARTNYTPAVVLYDGKKGESSTTKAGLGISSLIGFRGGIVIRTADGTILQKFGDPQPLSHVRLAVVAVALGFVGVLVARGFRK
jgi:hypothetical protein